MSATEKDALAQIDDITHIVATAQGDVSKILDGLSQLAARLRETAAGLDDKSIHPAHAANRLRKMARGIDGGK